MVLQLWAICFVTDRLGSLYDVHPRRTKLLFGTISAWPISTVLHSVRSSFLLPETGRQRWHQTESQTRFSNACITSFLDQRTAYLLCFCLSCVETFSPTRDCVHMHNQPFCREFTPGVANLLHVHFLCHNQQVSGPVVFCLSSSEAAGDLTILIGSKIEAHCHGHCVGTEPIRPHSKGNRVSETNILYSPITYIILKCPVKASIARWPYVQGHHTDKFASARLIHLILSSFSFH